MSHSTGRPGAADAATLVDQLHRRARQMDADDLGGLAQMHGLCEALVVSAEAGSAAPPLGERAASLARRLEQLILGECQDSAAALASIVEEVFALASADGSVASAPQKQSPPSDSPTNRYPGPPEGDQTDAAEQQLACVFDDAPPATTDQPAAAPDMPAMPAPEAAVGPAGSAETVVDGAPYESLPLILDPKELDFVKSFVEEAREHVESIEAALLEVERTPDAQAKIDDLFRPFHTIKGMAGFLNLRDINCLAHEAETLLDQARKGRRTVTSGLIDLVFDVVDILKAQIATIAAYLGHPTGESVPQPPIGPMIGKLRAVVAGRVEPESRAAGPGGSPQETGEILVEQGAVAREVVDFALDLQRGRPDAPKIGALLTEMGMTTPRQVDRALRGQKESGVTDRPAAAAGTPDKSIADQSVRIDTVKLDSLVDMVGELVIAQTLVAGHDAVAADGRLGKDVGQVTKIVRNVQEVVLAMRMIPIGPTFQKMARLLRDVSRKAGKQVELTLSGEDTELDKTVIQQIGDPLVHMVRNAVDHGIETPETRRAAGKSTVGHVHMSACHQGGNIVIEIADDGKGLDPQALIAKGLEKGLVAPGAELTNEQAYALIFAPGFSTADKVTDISGRGVGMDVVRRNIEQLRGKAEITSEKGRGTRFSIRLPLTLAIIDGMVVRVAGERFIIPTIALEQALRPRPEQLTTVQHRGELLQVRGRLIPLIQLGQMFGLTGRLNPCETMVVIARSDTDTVGLVVEELLGQQQVVIKSLGERFRQLRGVSGGAILGDGRVGLILETAGLTALHASRRTGAAADYPRDRGCRAADLRVGAGSPAGLNVAAAACSAAPAAS